MSQISFAPVRNAAASARSATVRHAPAPIRSAPASVRSAVISVGSAAPVRAATAPVRSATHTAMRAGRRRRRRRTLRAAIGSWWQKLKVALGLAPARRRVTDAPVPQIAAAVGVGAGAVAVVTMRRRRSRRGAYLEGRINGAATEVRPAETASEDDRMLADRVRTEIFRRPDAPNGSVDVSAVDGIVYLRGEVSSSDEIQRLIDDTLAVAGVLRVESMLHTAGTPAPDRGAG